MAKATRAQIEAIDRWNKAHKSKQRYFDYKSRVTTFLNKYATKDDVEDVILKAKLKLRQKLGE